MQEAVGVEEEEAEEAEEEEESKVVTESGVALVRSA